MPRPPAVRAWREITAPTAFGSRLADQYRSAREVHGLDDAELARLARFSIEGSRAPADVRTRLLREGDERLAAPAPRG